MVSLATSTGASAQLITDDVFLRETGNPYEVDGEINDDLATIQQAHSVARVEIKSEIIKKIAAAPELSEGEVADIRDAMIAQKDITEAQRHAFERHRLRVDYAYNGPIDEKFVGKYHDSKAVRVYKNTCRISAEPTIDESLARLQIEERAMHKYLMGMGELAQAQDINRRYVFDQHRYACGLLRLCGWSHIRDPRFIPQVTLAQSLNIAVHAESAPIIRAACVEFGLKTPALKVIADDRARIEYMLGPVNKILNIMYGIVISTRKSDPSMFFIHPCGLFTTDPAYSARANVPLIGAPAIGGFVAGPNNGPNNDPDGPDYDLGGPNNGPDVDLGGDMTDNDIIELLV